MNREIIQSGKRGMTGKHGNHARGPKNPRWNGGRTKTIHGYIKVQTPTGQRYEHIVMSELILGKALPSTAVVHHVNERKDDNRPDNFVVCQDESYHQLLHKRMRALRGCGDTHGLQCSRCKKYDSPHHLTFQPCGQAVHSTCLRGIATGKRHGWSIHPELTPKGESNGRSIYSEETVQTILSMFRSGHTQAEIYRHIGCSQSLVSRIVNRKIWRHLQEVEGE